MRQTLSLPLFLVVLTLAGAWNGSESAPSDDITTAQQLVEAMQARYAGKWYATLTFTQTSIQHKKDGTADTTLWYEALEMPGKLRIDFDPISEGNGFLFRADTAYSIQNGVVAQSGPQVHSLLLLGFDVYFLPVETSIKKLEGLGFDLTKFREAQWQGRPVYVVGADEGDETSPQFWIDRENLYFVRQIQPVGPGGKASQEVQFNKYERAGGGWVSPEVLFYINGNLAFEEHYSEMKTGMTFDAALFDPAAWRTAKHWR